MHDINTKNREVFTSSELLGLRKKIRKRIKAPILKGRETLNRARLLFPEDCLR
jgi:hypothetical protein